MKFFKFFLLLSLVASGQQAPKSNISYMGGRFIAYNYGQWTLPIQGVSGTTPGVATITLQKETVTLPDGRQIMPINVNAPLIVGTETVIPTSITGCVYNNPQIGTCQITASFTHLQPSSGSVRSGTFGLQEALNDAAATNGTVTVDGQWSMVGGTNAMITSASTPTGTGIEDLRAGPSQASFAGVYNAASYLKCNHIADDTAAFNSLLHLVYTSSGGTIQFPAGCVALINSAEITFPNNGDPTNPKQPSIRLTGAGSMANQTSAAGPDSMWPISGLDLRFNASDAKLVTLGFGKVEIDHMTIMDTGSDCAPFILTTNSQLMIHDNSFVGTAAGASACNTGIILGGNTDVLGGLVTSPFQGYGTTIRDNSFYSMSLLVKAQAFVNSVIIDGNYVASDCGNGTGAAIDFSNSWAIQSGNKISNNTIEVSFYKWGIRLGSTGNAGNARSVENFIYGNDCWDYNPAITSACVRFENGNIDNLLIAGFVDSGLALVSDANSPPQNPVLDYFGDFLPNTGTLGWTFNDAGPVWGQGTTKQWKWYDTSGDFFLKWLPDNDIKIHCTGGASGGGYCQFGNLLFASNGLAAGWQTQTQWDAWGMKHEGAPAPTVSAGTVQGTNQAGVISGLSAATTVTITFDTNGPWTTWQSCTANPSVSLAATPYVSAIGSTFVTFTFPSLTGKLYYQCGGK